METISSNNSIRWTTKVKCSHCGNEFHRKTGEVNRAIRTGKPLYCNKECFGLGRRKNLSPEEKKKLKSEYDKIYREKNIVYKTLKAKEYYKNNRLEILERNRIYRKKNMHRHVEYCRQPEYKKYKQKYDFEYRAKKEYGPFWESLKPLKDIEKELDRHQANIDNQTFNKSQKRKRLCQNKNLTRTI